MINMSPYNSYLEIDTSKIIENFLDIKRNIASDCKICCVVKANAYGHGAVMLSKIYQDYGADYLAVANIDEAIEIRQSGISLPILVLGYTSPNRCEELELYNITQTVISLEYANDLLKSVKNRLTVHIKIDTGMTRLGFQCENESIDSIVKLFANKKFNIEGIFTHFACEKSAKKQFIKFKNMLNALSERGVVFELTHCASSSYITNAEMQLNMVRPGIALYRGMGGNNYCMSLKAAVACCRRFSNGSKIGYNQTYMLNETSNIATIEVGYGDGLPRIISNKGCCVYKDGHKYNIVGMICMDQCMVNTGDKIITGTVEVIGNNSTTFKQIAQISKTIDYEIMCRMNQRARRIYK